MRVSSKKKTQPPEVFYVKKLFLEILQNSQENTCARVSFLIKLQAPACNFIKKDTLAQAFSCEFCEISKSTFFTEHIWTTASKKMTFRLWFSWRFSEILKSFSWKCSIGSVGVWLTFSWRKSLYYRSESIDLQSKSMDWFLYGRDLRHERVKGFT